MGKEKKPTDMQVAREQDAGDFGAVNDVSELELKRPEDVNQGRVDAHRKSLAPPDAVGYFEDQAAGFGSYADGPMKLGPKTMADGGGRLAEYEGGYNMYSQPLRSTVRAMGRVKDLQNAGAPMSATELQANPKLKARFRQLSLTEKADGPAQSAYGAFGGQMTHMNLDLKSFQAGQMQLASANRKWDEVRYYIQEKRKESEKAGKQAELNEINEAAETLAKIVEVSAEAFTMAGELGEALEATSALDEGAAETAMEPLAADETTESVATRGNKAASKAVAAKGAVGDASPMLTRVKAAVKASNGPELKLNLQDFFVTVMGNGPKKMQLEADITKLTQQIHNLEMKEAEAKIDAAKKGLEGFTMDVSVRKETVQADRQMSRKAAQSFNQNLSGGDAAAGEMAMLSAEAHMELAMMGNVANTERAQWVDPHWRWADAYLNDNHDRIDGFGEEDSRKKLAMNVFQVRDQKNYFAKHLPKWQAESAQWQQFLSSVGQSSFTAQRTKTDEKSDAP